MKKFRLSSEDHTPSRTHTGRLFQRIGLGAWISLCPMMLQAVNPDSGFEQSNFQENLISDFRKPELLKALNTVIAGKSKISAFATVLPKTTKSTHTQAADVGHQERPSLPERPFQDEAHQADDVPEKTHAPEMNSLSLTWNENELVLDPLVITFLKKGDEVHLNAQDSASSSLSEDSPDLAPKVFVRDQGVLEWDEGTHRFVAKTENGKTEVYITFQNQMLVVPVYIGSQAQNYFASREADSEGTDGEGPEEALQLTSISLTPSTAEERLAKREDEQEQMPPRSQVSSDTAKIGPIQRTQLTSGAVNIALQVVDERSIESDKNLEAQALFALAGVVVKLVGLNLEETTDATGQIPFLEVPKQSRFFVSVIDPYQRIKPTVVEVSVGEEDLDKPIIIKAMRTKQYDGLLEVMKLTGDPERSSVCGQVLGKDGLPQKGVMVGSVNSEVSGKPLYFGQSGFPDERLERTGEDGRFCWFNMESGPAALSFHSQNDEYLGTSLHPLFKGNHQELAINLEQTDAVSTRIVAMPSAYEYGAGLDDDRYRLVPRAKVLPIGEEESLSIKKRSQLVAQNASIMWGDRTHFLSDSREFENTFYTYTSPGPSDDVGDFTEHVTALVPRGFVEDMALNANLAYDPGMGSLIVDYGMFADESADATHRIFLVDEEGTPLEEPIYFGVAATRKALFVNLNPGSYSVVVENANGDVLSTNTAMVYSTVLSFANTGNHLVYDSSKELEKSHLASR